MAQLIGYLSEGEQLQGRLSDPDRLVGELSIPVFLGGGLTDEVKQALLDLFQHLAYTDADGQDYYDALYNAFYPPAELVSISAVYTQSGAVFEDTPLEDLEDDLVVTANYSDGTSEAVTTYTLSGTLTAGTSVVTVSYEDKTTTFNVTVSAPATLSSITAVYTQSGTVYPTDSLDSLKPDLVVTAHYSDSSTATVTTYTLSGTLTVGTSTITVTYSGKTTTFNVTVTAVPVLSSITAVYTQSGTVYDTDSLDSLKADLVVTAVYTDSSTEVVPSTDYTLSGTLTVGTSTITVSYEGETATFSVTVTEAPASAIYKWENLGTSLVDSVGGITASTNATQDSANNCISINASDQYIDFGEIYAYNRTYVVEFGTSDYQNIGSHARFFGVDSDSNVASGGHVWAYRNGNGFAFYTGSWSATIVAGTTAVRNMFGNSVMQVYLDSSGYAHVYKDGTLLGTSSSPFKAEATGLKVYIGSTGGDKLYNIQVKSMAVFSGEVINGSI